jgi:signal transduction histidine kinase
MDAMAQTDGLREVEISTELHDASEVVVTVRDNGMGLDQHMRTKMFEPFFTTKPDGIGMGLAICRSTIEEHDGRIWADSSGRGTAIHFSLRATT